jgi:hypothetical protein
VHQHVRVYIAHNAGETYGLAALDESVGLINGPLPARLLHAGAGRGGSSVVGWARRSGVAGDVGVVAEAPRGHEPGGRGQRQRRPPLLERRRRRAGDPERGRVRLLERAGLHACVPERGAGAASKGGVGCCWGAREPRMPSTAAAQPSPAAVAADNEGREAAVMATITSSPLIVGEQTRGRWRRTRDGRASERGRPQARGAGDARADHCARARGRHHRWCNEMRLSYGIGVIYRVSRATSWGGYSLVQ